jgi:hypothetical protein
VLRRRSWWREARRTRLKGLLTRRELWRCSRS